MHIFVYSYNRGRYLRNCLASIRRHAAKYSVTVIDDGSTDPEVSEALGEFAESVRVVRSTGDGDMYLGGLYGNMQRALEFSATEELALFIQDDMQIVRDIDEQDEAHWKRFFEHYPRSMQLTVSFLKPNRRSPTVHLETDSMVPVYFRDSRMSRRAHFTAVGLFHVARLREWGWQFALSEGDNDQKAREAGLQMGISPYPFMMWLPNAESSKFRRRGLVHRFAEWYRDVGFYPYRPMTPEQVNWLRQRDLSVIPLAQEHLEAEGLDPSGLWLFEDATKSIRFIHRHLKRRKKRGIARQKAQRKG